MEVVNTGVVKLLVLFASVAGAGSAAGFTLTIGPPIAAGTASKVTKTKGAAFAVRLEECGDLATAHLLATAEGLVNGGRTSQAVMPMAAGTPGVYLVAQNWPAEGVWVVKLSATCGAGQAGAIVPIADFNFVRDAVKLFPRAPTPSEIQDSLLDAEKKAMVRP